MKNIQGQPNFITSSALWPIASTCKKETGYDVVNQDQLNVIKNTRVPAIFLVGRQDVITPPQMVQNLESIYGGQPKKFLIVDGEHHTERTNRDIEFAKMFIEDNITFKFKSDSVVNRTYQDSKNGLAEGIYVNHYHNSRYLNGVSSGRGTDIFNDESDYHPKRHSAHYDHYNNYNNSPSNYQRENINRSDTWEEFKKHTENAWDQTKSGFVDMGQGLSSWTIKVGKWFNDVKDSHVFDGCKSCKTVEKGHEEVYELDENNNWKKLRKANSVNVSRGNDNQISYEDRHLVQSIFMKNGEKEEDLYRKLNTYDDINKTTYEPFSKKRGIEPVTRWEFMLFF